MVLSILSRLLTTGRWFEVIFCFFFVVPHGLKRVFSINGWSRLFVMNQETSRQPLYLLCQAMRSLPVKFQDSFLQSDQSPVPMLIVTIVESQKSAGTFSFTQILM